MQKEQTIEMNKVIADFMGYYYAHGKFYSKSSGRGNWFKEPRYHSSWDWLLPVWVKIYHNHYLGFLEHDYKHFTEKFVNLFAIYVVNDTDISRCHQIVYEAILWINQNKIDN